MYANQLLSQWIKQRRRILDLTQAELADRIGCSISILQKIEEGKRRPSKQMAELLAVHLEIAEAEKIAFLNAARDAEVLEPSIFVKKTGKAQSPPQSAPQPLLQPAVQAQSNTSNLPTPLTPLIGRVAEMQTISTLLARVDVRLLTLTGSAGVGKTRLSIAVACQLLESNSINFLDGVWFVALAALEEAHLLLSTIAQVLNVRQSGSQPLLDEIARHLYGKRILLLLDNFEQIVEAATEVGELLIRCPGLKLLVTSRIVLNLSGEYEFPLAPLALPPLTILPSLSELAEMPVVKLFMQRAQAVNHSLRLNPENALTIASLCVQLEGLPLAIELAAVRSRIYSPTMLLDELQGDTRPRLNLLTHNMRDVERRHSSLRSAIAWSVDRLPSQQRQAFACLSILPTDSPLEVGLVVTASDFATLSALREQSLLQISHHDAEPRLYMLESLREYGQELLHTLPNETESLAHRRLLDWCISLCGPISRKAAQATLEKGDYSRFKREQQVIAAALNWALSRDPRSGLYLACAASYLWYRFSFYQVGRDWLERFIEIAGEEDEVHAVALHNLGLLQERTGQVQNCLPYLQKARQIYDKLGMLFEVAHTDVRMADVCHNARDEKEQAEALCLAALPIFEIEKDDTNLAWIYSVLAVACEQRKPDSEVEYWADRCYAHAIHGEDSHSRMWMIAIAGEYDIRFGKVARAQERLTQSLAIAHKHSYWAGAVYAALCLVAVYRLQKDIVAGRAAACEALDAAEHCYAPGYLSRLGAHLLLWLFLNRSQQSRLAFLGHMLSFRPKLMERFSREDGQAIQEWIATCKQEMGADAVQELLQSYTPCTYEQLLAEARTLL